MQACSSRAFSFVLGVLLLAACGDQPPGAADGPEPPIDRPTFPDCQGGPPTITVGVLDSDAREIGPSLAIVEDGQLVVHLRQTQYTNSPSDQEVFLVDTESRDEVQLTANDQDDVLLDARLGQVLYLTWPGGAGEGEIRLWRAGQTRTLGSGRVESRLSIPWEPVRWIGPDLVAWRWGEWNDARTVRHWFVSMDEGAGARRISGDLVANGAPDVQGDRIVWSARDAGQGDILLSTRELRSDGVAPDYRSVTSDEHDDVGPLLSDERIYFIRGAEPAVHDLATATTERLSGYECRRHAVGAGLGVYVCPFSLDEYRPQQLIVLDGAEVIRTIETEGEIAALSMDGHALAWVVYEAPAGIGGDVGTVYWLGDVRSAAQPSALSEIGSGCWSCGALWPPVEVHLTGHLVAWNYAMDSGEPEYMRWGGIGYALVEPTVSCAP